MVKGCQRKAIHIRETGSSYFEEAYFILKVGVEESDGKSAEMIDEAMRIVGERLEATSMKKKRRLHGYRSLVIFASGCLWGGVVFFLLMLLVYVIL